MNHGPPLVRPILEPGPLSYKKSLRYDPSLGKVSPSPSTSCPKPSNPKTSIPRPKPSTLNSEPSTSKDEPGPLSGRKPQSSLLRNRSPSEDFHRFKQPHKRNRTGFSSKTSISGHVSRTELHLCHESTGTKDLKSNSKGKLFDANEEGSTNSDQRTNDKESTKSGQRTNDMGIKSEEIINLNSRECIHCSKKLSSVQGLKSHLLSIHGLGSSADCLLPSCGYRAVSPFRLRRHIKTHGIILHSHLSNELMLKAREQFETSARLGTIGKTSASLGTIGKSTIGTDERTGDLETDTRYKWHRGGRKKVVKIEDPEEIHELLTVRLGRKDAAHCRVSMTNLKEDGTMTNLREDGTMSSPRNGRIKQEVSSASLNELPTKRTLSIMSFEEEDFKLPSDMFLDPREDLQDTRRDGRVNCDGSGNQRDLERRGKKKKNTMSIECPFHCSHVSRSWDESIHHILICSGTMDDFDPGHVFCPVQDCSMICASDNELMLHLTEHYG